MIAANLHKLFPGMTLLDSYPFRVTRNADMEIEEDEASDLLETIEAGVRQRRFGRVVRLEVEADMPQAVLDLLKGYLNIERSDIYQGRGPLGMSQLFELADLDVPELKFVPFVPQRPAVFNQQDDIFSVLRNRDILLHHPTSRFCPWSSSSGGPPTARRCSRSRSRCTGSAATPRSERAA